MTIKYCVNSCYIDKNEFLDVDSEFYDKLKSYCIYKEIEFTQHVTMLIHKESGTIVAYKLFYE